ncbi:MAG: ABC transporter permease [Gemmatimonadaceae bacterium]
MSVASSFLEATVRTATPLALVALGELLAERAGVINIGVEGAILAGAFGAFAGATVAGTPAGYLAGAAAGALVALLFAFFVLRLRADQIVTGTAVTLAVTGLTGALYRAFYEQGAALAIPTSGALAIPVLSELPLFGRALFAQPWPTYLAYLLVPLVWWWSYRTQAGLALRAIGEAPEAARSAGVATGRYRLAALTTGGMLGGLAGATLVLAQAGTFAEGMSAGRGFIAIAIVVLGRWHPVGVALAALLFGGASALQYLFQAVGWPLPYQLFLALPYVLTLAALGGVGGRARAPAALAKNDPG